MPISLDGEPGVILHTRPYKENSLLVELYTLNYGRISAVARLSKKVASRSKGAYQPFLLLKMTLSQGRGQLWQLKDVFLQRAGFALEVPQIFIAQYLNELLFYLIKTRESDPQLFASYIKVLEALERKEESYLSSLREFELTLIEGLGYGLSFLDTNSFQIEDDGKYIFDPHNGFCRANISSKQVLDGRTIKLIEAREFASKEVLQALKMINKSVISTLLDGKQLKSRELYAQYLMV
ncbi:MAG: DNA repair protein RecO [Aeromonadales bacterium]|nr:DNA repair protein RecO [Aeromonadales bacterium]